jgi:hypothetical protein
MESPLYHSQHLRNISHYPDWDDEFEDRDRLIGMSQNPREQEEQGRVAEEKEDEMDDLRAGQHDPHSQVGLSIAPMSQCSSVAVRYARGAYKPYQRHRGNNQENDAIELQGPRFPCISTLHTSAVWKPC